MRISINCPSYKRPDNVEVLEYIPICRIWVCDSEYKSYSDKNPKAKIISCKKGIQGNVARIRNYILDSEFKRGIGAVCIVDDDLQYLGYHQENERHRMDKGEIKDFILRYSIMAREFGAQIWGINLNQDKQSYREYTPFSFLSVVLGPFTVHLRNKIRYDERFLLKEDYDISIQHLNKLRKVFRLNKYFYVARQGGSGSGQKGGCSTYRNLKREKDQLKLLQKKWGSQIVKYDFNPRSHSSTKVRSFDINPVIKVPIRGV